MNFDLLLHDVGGLFRLSLEGNYFSPGGYDVVKKSRRGSIDIEADSNHSTFNGRVELLATREASVFVSGSYFYEARNNGTPLQINHTETGSGAIGGRLGTPDQGEWRLRVFPPPHQIRSPFSTHPAHPNLHPPARAPRPPDNPPGRRREMGDRVGEPPLLPRRVPRPV